MSKDKLSLLEIDFDSYILQSEPEKNITEVAINSQKSSDKRA